MNRRRTLWVTYQGRTLTLMEWAEQTGIAYATLWWRTKQGWALDRVFHPVRSPEIAAEVRAAREAQREANVAAGWNN